MLISPLLPADDLCIRRTATSESCGQQRLFPADLFISWQLQLRSPAHPAKHIATRISSSTLRSHVQFKRPCRVGRSQMPSSPTRLNQLLCVMRQTFTFCKYESGRGWETVQEKGRRKIQRLGLSGLLDSASSKNDICGTTLPQTFPSSRLPVNSTCRGARHHPCDAVAGQEGDADVRTCLRAVVTSGRLSSIDDPSRGLPCAPKRVHRQISKADELHPEGRRPRSTYASPEEAAKDKDKGQGQSRRPAAAETPR